MKATRITLVAFGILLLLVGAYALVLQVPASNYLAIVLWFGGAILVHDGVIAPIVFGVSLVMRRAGKRIPWGVLAIVQAALVVAAVFAAIVIPAALKKRIGTGNATLLPLDYAHNLLYFYAALVVATGVAIALYLVVTRRRRAPRAS
jgi:hypothetical protein